MFDIVIKIHQNVIEEIQSKNTPKNEARTTRLRPRKQSTPLLKMAPKEEPKRRENLKNPR